MPWIAPPGARVVEPGRLEPGAGLALLFAPAEPQEVVPVPQAWLRIGVARSLDLGVSWAAPMTGIADLRWQAFTRRTTAIAAGFGAGVHAFPDLGGLGEAIALPVGTAYVSAERASPARTWYGFARAWVPAYLDGEPYAAVVWAQLGIGMEARGRHIGHGPQIGVVVPSTGIEDAVAIVSWSLRRNRRRSVSRPYSSPIKGIAR